MGKVVVATVETLDMRERILQAAEDLLRRHGPEKMRVIDIARHLGMSHANVYRHFDSKADIEDLVAARWLSKITDSLDRFVRGRGSAEKRLRGWVRALIAVKQEKVQSDPELFATYNSLAEASRGVIAQHVAHLREQLAAIVRDGVAGGEFKVANVAAAARAMHEATGRFQHPYFVTRGDAKLDGVEAVMDLLIAGLRAGVI